MIEFKDLENLRLDLDVTQEWAERVAMSLHQNLPELQINKGLQALLKTLEIEPSNAVDTERFQKFTKGLEAMGKRMALPHITLPSPVITPSSYPLVGEMDVSHLVRLIRKDPEPRTPIGFFQNKQTTE